MSGLSLSVYALVLAVVSAHLVDRSAGWLVRNPRGYARLALACVAAVMVEAVTLINHVITVVITFKDGSYEEARSRLPPGSVWTQMSIPTVLGIIAAIAAMIILVVVLLEYLLPGWLRARVAIRAIAVLEGDAEYRRLVTEGGEVGLLTDAYLVRLRDLHAAMEAARMKRVATLPGADPQDGLEPYRLRLAALEPDGLPNLLRAEIDHLKRHLA
jgi:hypothetical protein